MDLQIDILCPVAETSSGYIFAFFGKSNRSTPLKYSLELKNMI